MSGCVPPSSRGRLKPARGSSLARGVSLFERFTGHDADNCMRVKAPKVLREAVAIGALDGVLYTTERDGRIEKYIHRFAAKDRPMLAVSPDGRQLIILGGRYRFTSLGIVDSSDRKHRNAR